jgi:hypothetical protein
MFVPGHLQCRDDIIFNNDFWIIVLFYRLDGFLCELSTEKDLYYPILQMGKQDSHPPCPKWNNGGWLMIP